MSLGREMARRREALGLDRKAMAKAIGIALPTLVDIEEGKRNPQRGTVERIRAYLDAGEPDTPPTPRARRKAAPEPQEEPEPEAQPETEEEGEAQLDGAVSGDLILERIDAAMESLRATRMELAPDDAVPMPVKCRDLAALARRIAAIEVALIKAGIRLEP
jgi:transcriptional regulator with XRE-family HTH domain